MSPDSVAEKNGGDVPGLRHRLIPMGSRTLVLACAAIWVLGSSVSTRADGADEAPVATLELTIAHGKLSTPREKRDVSKVKLHVPLNGKDRKISSSVLIPYATNSSAGYQTQFIDSNAPAEFIVTAKQAAGGVELKTVIMYNNPVPVPDAAASPGVSQKTAISGFQVNSQVVLPARESTSVEIGSIEDPVADRAWSATISLAGFKGSAPVGEPAKNSTFTARIEEGTGKTSETTILQVTTMKGLEARIEEKYAVPFASASSAGTMVQFIDSGIKFIVTSDPKGSGAAKALVMFVRPGGKETSPVFEVVQETTLVPGLPKELGLISEGGRTIRATLEESAR